ncbi:MAG: DsbE family thiol:disulfide interchange protein [Rhodobacterales bacterium]|nr:DsbE family thiol:disulfide interchange protein [Rhodobacterales bacterium]
MKRLVYLLPLLVLLVMGGYFVVGLGMDPRELPNMLEGKPVPDFDLKPIKGRDRGFRHDDLLGQVSIVNVFGSWCVACRVEHPFLVKIKQQGLVPVYGIDWREKDADAGPAWLRRFGDPYTLVGDDPQSKAAIAFGVTGAPESFLVDKQGVVRYKHVGPVDQEVWDNTLWPLIQELRK